MKKRALVAALVAVLSLIAGCGADDGSTVPADKPYNDADLTFATDMIQHHAQALSMVDTTMGRDLDPEVAALAEDIRAAQAPQIETMVGWLRDWDRSVPATVRDHANAHSDGMGMHGDVGRDMPGMMSSEQMESLEDAHGDAFERMWLTMMIEHHQGAIEMANTEQEHGDFDPAVELASSVVSGQQTEIEQMHRLLDS